MVPSEGDLRHVGGPLWSPPRETSVNRMVLNGFSEGDLRQRETCARGSPAQRETCVKRGRETCVTIKNYREGDLR